jgi:hypothetical protein
MPVNENSYQKACIYKIWSLETDKIYIGSTCDMIKRWNNHKSTYKKWKDNKSINICSSNILFDMVGVENCKIEWIKDFPCNSKKELNKEEGRMQRQFKDLLVNQLEAGRTPEQYYQDHKEEKKERNIQYYHNNKEEIKEYRKQYVQDHKEEIKEYKKQYYQDHKEERKEYKKQYLQHHKEEINRKHTCDCGGKYTLRHKSTHFKSKKHQKFLKD